MDKFTERLLQLVLTLWLMLILLWIGWHVIHLMYVLFQWLLKKILNIFCAWLLPVLKYPTLGFHYPSAMVFHRPEMSSRTFTNSCNVSTAGSNPVAGRVCFHIQSTVKNDRKTQKALLRVIKIVA